MPVPNLVQEKRNPPEARLANLTSLRGLFNEKNANAHLVAMGNLPHLDLPRVMPLRGQYIRAAASALNAHIGHRNVTGHVSVKKLYLDGCLAAHNAECSPICQNLGNFQRPSTPPARLAIQAAR